MPLSPPVVGLGRDQLILLLVHASQVPFGLLDHFLGSVADFPGVGHLIHAVPRDGIGQFRGRALTLRNILPKGIEIVSLLGLLIPSALQQDLIAPIRDLLQYEIPRVLAANVRLPDRSAVRL